MSIDWSAWELDWLTIWVSLWFLQFALIEVFGASSDNMVTDHLRPVFHAAPVTWYLALGTWLWLGPHFLFPALEQRIQSIVGG